MSKPPKILLILSSTSVVTFTAGQTPGSSTNITVPGTGQFKVYMALYKDSGYTTPYSGPEVTFSTEEFLHIGVYILGGDTSNFVLVMKDCYATTTDDITDLPKYYIIQNGCPTKQDGAITVVENGLSRKGRFSVQLFKFVGNYYKMNLHCAVSLCDISTGPCRPDCTTARSQRGGIGLLNILDPFAFLTIRPIVQSALSQVVPDLTCKSFDMRATFHKSQLNDLHIHFDKSHVENDICYDFQDDPVTNTFTILVPLQVGCGVWSYETSDGQVTYKTVITILVEEALDEMITRTNTLNINLQCSYALDLITSLRTTISFIKSPVNEMGEFEAYVTLYKDSDYTTPYTGLEVTLSAEQFLYVGVFSLGGETSNLLLVMKNCYATPSKDVKDPLKYYIIENSCPNKADGSITVEENGVSSKGRFSVQMFQFVGNYDLLYLHCTVGLCDIPTGPCAPVCATERVGSDGTGSPESFGSTIFLTIGPIRRSVYTESSTIGSSAIPSPIPTTSESSTISSSTIGSSTIDSSAIGSSTIDSSAIDSAAIDSSTIDSSAIGSSTIDSSAIGSSAIDSSTIDSSAIDSSAIDSSTIGSSTIDSSTIDSPAIGSSTIDSSAIGSSAISSSTIGSSTIPSKSTQTCKADEEWQLKDNQYGCFCKDPYKVTDLSQVVPQLTCGLYEMTATFHKCQFNDLNIYFNQTHVEDNICFNFQDDPVTNTFTILVPLQVGSCRVQTYDRNGSHVTYKSSVTIVVDEPGAIYTRKNTLNINLKCSYGLDLITSLYPITSSIKITVPWIGTFETTLAFYKDSGYNNPFSGSEDTLSTEDFLYVGVFIQGGDASNLVLVIKNCYATPSNDVNDPLKYYIIQNSCPNMQDKTIDVLENGVSRQGRFSVKMFKFVKNSNRVFLHCAVSLCDSGTGPCAPNCSPGESRSDATGTPQTYDAPSAMTNGPIHRSEEPGSSTINKPGSSTINKPGSSTINSAHILWTLLIPALIILIQSL
ncbi:uncharacterized protein LOC144000332 isoform X1 [Lithobates pipiens]